VAAAADPAGPAQQETLASWLHRLATVHGLPVAELRHHLHVGTRVIGDQGLSALTELIPPSERVSIT
jgi:hypothetical protein